jgi:hypothetical protein
MSPPNAPWSKISAALSRYVWLNYGLEKVWKSVSSCDASVQCKVWLADGALHISTCPPNQPRRLTCAESGPLTRYAAYIAVLHLRPSRASGVTWRRSTPRLTCLRRCYHNGQQPPGRLERIPLQSRSTKRPKNPLPPNSWLNGWPTRQMASLVRPSDTFCSNVPHYKVFAPLYQSHQCRVFVTLHHPLLLHASVLYCRSWIRRYHCSRTEHAAIPLYDTPPTCECSTK